VRGRPGNREGDTTTNPSDDATTSLDGEAATNANNQQRRIANPSTHTTTGLGGEATTNAYNQQWWARERPGTEVGDTTTNPSGHATTSHDGEAGGPRSQALAEDEPEEANESRRRVETLTQPHLERRIARGDGREVATAATQQSTPRRERTGEPG
jgi:hypothetical protein